MIRRRQEREEINRLLDDQVEASDDSPDDLKPEVLKAFILPMLVLHISLLKMLGHIL